MDREKHELFHSWLSWKKQKTGWYPRFKTQRRVLTTEYGGVLLNEIRSIGSGYTDAIPMRGSLEDHLPKLSEEKSEELFNELRKLRKRLADEKNIPVYIVFKNFTLWRMVETLPENDADLLKIIGWTQEKVRLYGAEFLAAIKKHKSEF